MKLFHSNNRDHNSLSHPAIKVKIKVILKIEFVFTLLVSVLVVLATEVQSESLGEIENDFLIDERFPIIISNSFNNGDDESLFGATVTLLKSDKTWIFIGEPKGNATGVELKEPGVLWKCELSFERNNAMAVARGNFCRMIQVDDITGDPNKKAQAYGGTWFGGSVSVIPPLNGGSRRARAKPQLIACAHRKSFTPTETDLNDLPAMPMSGACYIFDMDTLDSKSYNSKLMPDDSATEIFDTVKKQNVTSIKFSHAAFGMSLNVKGDLIFVGSPGPSALQNNTYNSTVSPFGVERSSPLTPSRRASFSDDDIGPYLYGYAVTSGNYYEQDGDTTSSKTPAHFAGGSPRENHLKGAVRISSTTMEDTPPSAGQSDPGHSSKKLVQIIPGFHFASYFGSVLYTQDIDGDGIDELFVGAPNTPKLLPHFFSKRIHPFLNELAEADGEPAVGVGSEFNGDVTTSLHEDGDVGAVYVYRSNVSSKSSEIQVVQILTGANQPFSRFGSAISSIQYPRVTLDVPPKKFIVVGAPYEDGDVGAIYFYDTNTLLISRKFSKRVTPSQFPTTLASSGPSTLRGFGFSISEHQEDVDSNGTPELVVGSQLSKSVVVLRTRHQLKFTNSSITVKSSTGPLDLENPSSELGQSTCTFSLHVIIEYTISNSIVSYERSNKVLFWTRLQVDTAEGRYNTLSDTKDPNIDFYPIDNQTIEFSTLFLNQKPSDKNLQTETIKIYPEFKVTKVGVCDPSQSYSETGLPPDIEIKLKSWFSETEKLSQSKSRMDYQIIADPGNPQQTVLAPSEHDDQFRPYLPAATATQVLTRKIKIAAVECRAYNVAGGRCEPNLIIDRIDFTTIKGESLNNSFTIGTAPEILLRWRISNKNDYKESAIKPGTFIEYSFMFNSNSSESGPEVTILSLEDNSGCSRPILTRDSWFRFSCNDSSSLLHPQKELSMQVKLNMTGFYPSRTEQKIKFRLTPTHDHQDTDLPQAEGAEIKILAEAQVSIMGNRASKNIISVKNIPSVQHSYKVSLLGRSPVDKIILDFFIPLKREESDIEDLINFNESQPTIASVATNNPTQNKNEENPRIPIQFNCSLIPTKQPLVSPASDKSTSSSGIADGVGVSVNVPTFKSPEIPKTTQSESGRNSKQYGYQQSDDPMAGAGGDTDEDDNRKIDPKTGKLKSLEFVQNETLVLSCNQNNENSNPSNMTVCRHIRCSIANVDRKAQFNVQFSMELSKGLLADLSFSGRNTVLIESTGNARIFADDPSGNNLGNQSHIDTDVAEVKLIRVQLKDEADEAPVWIHILGALGGIVFLVVCVFVLYKCGFFKRDMKETMENSRFDRTSRASVVAYTAKNATDDDAYWNNGESPERTADNPEVTSQDRMLE